MGLRIWKVLLWMKRGNSDEEGRAFFFPFMYREEERLFLDMIKYIAKYFFCVSKGLAAEDRLKLIVSTGVNKKFEYLYTAGCKTSGPAETRSSGWTRCT